MPILKASLNRRLAGYVVLVCLALLLNGCRTGPGPRVEPVQVAETSGDARLAAVIEAIRVKEGLTALAVGLIVQGRTEAVAATGVREYGRAAPVTAADRFMIGSCSKSLTSTLAGIMVDEELIGWQTTIGQVFSGVEMRREYESITLEQLLSHRAGLAKNYKGGKTTWRIDYDFDPGRSDKPRSHRLQHLENSARQPLAFPPGTRVHYSNAGYLIAGAMLERTADRPFETLLQEKLFKPLAITSAGYGPPAGLEPGGQPWGHYWDEAKGVFVAYKAELNNFMAPAGHMHMSMIDWTRFISLHLGVFPPGKPLLSQITLNRLHRPPDLVRWDINIHLGLNYALGWFTKKSKDGHSLIWHGGRGFDFNAQVTADLDSKSAILVVSTAELPHIHPQTHLLQMVGQIEDSYAGEYDLPSVIP